jgi:hypothetical protein
MSTPTNSEVVVDGRVSSPRVGWAWWLPTGQLAVLVVFVVGTLATLGVVLEVLWLLSMVSSGPAVGGVLLLILVGSLGRHRRSFAGRFERPFTRAARKEYMRTG